MKAAITGHTSGLGKAFLDIYPDAKVFSRSNGHDISDPSIRTKIVDEIQDCDIFINNAHSGFSQTEILFEVWNRWKYYQKTIVCIGSRTSDLLHTKYPHYEYAVQKSSLASAVAYMSFQDLPCRVTLVKPGYIDTPVVKNTPAKKMSPEELSQFIKYMIETPRTFWVPEITIYPR